ncbi:repair protein PSO2 SNM1 [Tieghemiomyces parasiticus]|uniref:Repair protein PSO2 SNM1 n=1 Tax=Tieghemiomyces parasiticus TaxID=78921 RepID=A0A9W8E1J7_9FUNG|nr:repair protein PSO2 SNM1 [Tieghemiomyces parasiticus]
MDNGRQPKRTRVSDPAPIIILDSDSEETNETCRVRENPGCGLAVETLPTTPAATNTSQPVSAVAACPICNETFAADQGEAARQTHANRCLDLLLGPDDGEATDPSQDLVSVPPGLAISAVTARVASNDHSPASLATASYTSTTTYPAASADDERPVGRRKTCPWYKRMPHTPFAVDAFNYGPIPDCTAYFLTHYHADHYGGLRANFDYGYIYCTTATANLVRQQLRVDARYIRALPLNKMVLVDGVQVTLIEANHCPGSVLIYFCIPRPGAAPYRILHTGDFRACPAQCRHACVAAAPLDAVYLDTTYLDPTYSFPPQQEVINAATTFCRRLQAETDFFDTFFPTKTATAPASGMMSRLDSWFAKDNSTDTSLNVKSETTAVLKSERPAARILYVVGTYSIGKERIFVSIAQALRTKVFVTYQKNSILSCLEDPELAALVTYRAAEAQVHVISMHKINKAAMSAYLDEHPSFTHLVAIKPTGWTFAGPGPPRRGAKPAAGTTPERLAAQTSKSRTPAKSAQTTLFATFLTASQSVPPTPSNTMPLAPPLPPSPSPALGDPPVDLVPAPTAPYTDASMKPMAKSSQVLIFGVPYSEHSSFRELAAFVLALRVNKVIPTVNMGNPEKRAAMQVWLDRWQDYKRIHGTCMVSTRDDYW